MLVQKIQDIEEYSIGALLGKPDMGVRVRRFTNRTIGQEHYINNYSLEHYTVEPGKSCPVLNKGGDTIYIIESGGVFFEGETVKVAAKRGDIVYARPSEVSLLRNLGDEQAEILCAVDIQN